MVFLALCVVLRGFPAAAYQRTPHRKPLCARGRTRATSDHFGMAPIQCIDSIGGSCRGCNAGRRERGFGVQPLRFPTTVRTASGSMGLLSVPPALCPAQSGRTRTPQSELERNHNKHPGKRQARIDNARRRVLTGSSLRAAGPLPMSVVHYTHKSAVCRKRRIQDRILVQYQGGRGFLTGGIRLYFED